MKITQKIPYVLKRAVPSIMLLGATLLPGCKKDEIQKHDVELHWYGGFFDEIAPFNVQHYLDDPTVNKVYLKIIKEEPDYWQGTEFISWDRRDYLEPPIGMDPARVRGRGNLAFEPGMCSKADSLWFVYYGWTVNAQNQR